ncbi:hypothetical protein D3C72_2134920 [compost metagenome]
MLRIRKPNATPLLRLPLNMAASMPDTARVYGPAASTVDSGDSGTPRSSMGSGGAMSGRSLATMIT